MTTNHTTNYQLNQWEATDQVLRTEFNADNAKIDAALKANADAIAGKADAADVTALEADMMALSPKAGLQLLKTGTVSAASVNWTISLSGIDWTAWKAVYVYIDPYADTGGRYHITWGGNTSINMSFQNCNTTTGGTGRRCPLLIFYPMFSGTQQVCCLALGVDMVGVYNLETDYGQNESIVLVPSNGSDFRFRPGSVCKIYGEK